MEKDKLTVAINMQDYKNKIKDYDFAKLEKEKQKIEDSLNVNYIQMGVGMYFSNKKNIANDPDEKNRIYVRKKVSIVVKIISGQLSKTAVDFASYWKYINDEFLKTTSDPDYVSAKLQGKNVPFADKLNLQGLVAYKRYLILLSDSLEKIPFFKMAVQVALDAECDADRDMHRENFYTRSFLPNDIDAIFKKLMKEKIVSERMKELGNTKIADKEELNK